MTQKLSESVSVQMVFDHRLHKANPQQIFWNNKIYPITQVGLRHCFREAQANPYLFFN
jgi:hypothetical protein